MSTNAVKYAGRGGVGMGRRSAVAAARDGEFLPGVTLDQLRRMIRAEKDPRNVMRRIVAYNYKAGRTIAEIADYTGESRGTVRRWVAIMLERGLDGIPRRTARGKGS